MRIDSHLNINIDISFQEPYVFKHNYFTISRTLLTELLTIA